MVLPLRYIVILLISATAVQGFSVSCNETEYAKAGEDVAIKCNISAKAFQMCRVRSCICDSKVCDHGKMNCNWTEAELHLRVLNVNENQDFKFSIYGTCGIVNSSVQLKVYRNEKQEEERTSPPERSHAANVAVGGIFGVISAALLLVVLKLPYKKHKRASSNSSSMNLI